MPTNMIRLIVNVRGEPRTVLGIDEDDNGEVRLYLKPAKYYRDQSVAINAEGSRIHGKRVLQQRYSLHPSLASVEGVNYFKHTYILEDEKPVVTSHSTKAIKQNGRIAPIFCRRFPNIGLDKYKVSSKAGDNRVIGEMEPEQFTLRMGVFATKSDHIFGVPASRFYTMTELQLNIFKILIVHCFLTVPSDGTGFLSHATTEDQKTITDPGILEFYKEVEKGMLDAQLDE